MKKYHYVLGLFALAVAVITLSSHVSGMATNYNSDRTGAPSAGQCSSCHSGGGFGTVTPAIQVFEHGTTNTVTAYTPGTLYDIKVTINHTAGSPVGYGFQFTCLTTPGNVAVGGYSALASNVKQKTITSGTFNGRTYTENSGLSSSNVFTFSWTAPAAGTGSVKFYTAGDAVNGNNNDSQDNAGKTSLTLTEAQASTLAVTGTVTNVLCNGDANGAINVTVTGGTSPYTYNWGSGVTTEDRTGLTAGSYTVTITDNVGATASSTYTITQPAALTVAVASVTNDAGTGTGAISINVAGGTGPYTYQWSNSATTKDVSQLQAGVYSVTVTDANNCTVAQGEIAVQVTGIEDVALAGIKIYPNPVTDRIFIRGVNAARAYDVKLIALNGAVIKTVKLSDAIAGIPVADLPAGTYILEVGTRNTATRKTIVIK